MEKNVQKSKYGIFGFFPLQFRPFAEYLHQMCEFVCKGKMAALCALNQVDLQLLRRNDESWQESSEIGVI